MSDPDTSGAKATAPAETTNAASSGDSQPNFAFGTSRGSGLARGKRNSPAAPAAAATPNPVGYTPTVIEMINPKSEYLNPFAPVKQPAPPPAAPVDAIQPEAPAPVAAATAPVAPAPKPVVIAPAPVAEAKAELNILPPTEIKHPAQSWENSGSANRSADSTAPRRHHEERPTFRPESRQRRDAPEVRAPREARDPRAPRETREPREARSPESFTPRTESKPVQSGGFIGWLKGLFSTKPEEPKPTATYGHDDQRQPHRHNRGGRGRSRNFNGPRGENSDGRGSDQGQPQGDRPRRRSRGGRNRNRGGDQDGPRSGGQQGGGAI